MRSSFVAGSIGAATLEAGGAGGATNMLEAASAFRSAPLAAIAPAARPVFFKNSRRSDIGDKETREGTTGVR